ncbi:MAG: PAS domain-containing protein [Rhodocyclaceae bacterium]|nr:PAS domain-containing protein [Rhodocyclaceae bacterium]MBX3667471.1 PAS domain-containing protein [Rhodocyclaceae bacterium]
MKFHTSLAMPFLLPALGVVGVAAAGPAQIALLPAALAALLACALAYAAVLHIVRRGVDRPLADLAARFAALDEVPGAWMPVGDVLHDLAHHAQRAEQRLARQTEQLARAEFKLREAESAMRLAEERYVQAVRSANDGLWEWDLRNDEMYLSPRWKSMLGYSELELADTRAAWLARVHPVDAERVQQALKAHLEGAMPRYECEYRVLHRDGQPRWVLSRGAVVRHASGTPYRMLGLDTDITRLKRVECILDAVVEGTSGTWGRDFFRALVRHFARALEVPCAFITECADYPPTRLRTLAIWSEAGATDNFEYDLAGTPCENVVLGARSFFCPDGVGARFPAEAGYEGYLGLPIFSSAGEVMGHLAFLDTRRMDDAMLVESIYRIFTARAAAELERLQAVAQLDHLRTDFAATAP